MTININELRRLTQAATLGGWYVKRGNHIYGCKEVTDGEEKWHPVIACTDDDEVNVNFEANAAFIAAANPAAISELLDRLEAAEEERDALRAELDALKTWKAEVEAQKPVGYWDPRDDMYFLPGFLLPHSEAKMEPRYAHPVPAAKGEEK